MARKWSCLHESITLSRRLGRCSLLAALVYTWGISKGDAYGVQRRDDVRVSVVGKRKVSQAMVEAAADELLSLKLICQPEHGGDLWLHWCFWDDYQVELVRKRTVAPRFEFTCPSEGRAIRREVADISAGKRQIKRKKEIKIEKEIKTAAVAAVPPPPPESVYMKAVMETWPTAGAMFYQPYEELLDEVGDELALAAFQEAQRSGQVRPSVKYLRAITDRCQQEGIMPGDRQEKRDGHTEPAEIDGHRVVGTVGGTPIVSLPPDG